MLLNTFWEATGAILVWFFIVIPIMMLWGFALVDLFRRSDIRWRKVVWLLAIIFVPILGSLAYPLLPRVCPHHQRGRVQRHHHLRRC